MGVYNINFEATVKEVFKDLVAGNIDAQGFADGLAATAPPPAAE